MCDSILPFFTLCAGVTSGSGFVIYFYLSVTYLSVHLIENNYIFNKR